MTPKEKAQELVEKFKDAAKQFNFHEATGWYLDEEVTKENAVACAEICVDEILLAFGDCGCNPILPGTFGIKEWNEVKKEINSL